MLVLSTESCCDVCAESYAADSLPHSIPCGHTFCAPCLTEIAKRHRGAGAGCPLCREPFAAADIRRIRTDQGVSSSPPYPQIQPYPNYYPAPQAQPAPAPARGFGAAPLDEDALDDGDSDDDAARRLEMRVLDATRKGNSFEELSRLKREIDQWLARRPDREHMALKISAALLAAILVNGFQHNEAKKSAKLAEDAKRKLEGEVYRLKLDISKLTGAPPPPPPPVLAAPVPPGVGARKRRKGRPM
ncbi:hypothetical protein AURDEDRAFT_130803 [Auricularia subglabra TFB-10046 SS5]|uniref:RING-type domain-containing protein n=1 Tax=Auricularia subglabra (strain TFB-10046 / SS5) TaxID=717982 RepID=J0CWR5_AURST|nr:hypothetical protein AURDEDRAFT_130803 [Auricularia subglabra TFB-10046 SS5]